MMGTGSQQAAPSGEAHATSPSTSRDAAFARRFVAFERQAPRRFAGADTRNVVSHPT